MRTDITMRDEERAAGAAVEGQAGADKSPRVDPVSLVAGLLFIAIALAALTDRYWVRLDAVLVAGGAVIAVGLAIIAGVILRSRRGEHEGS